MAKKRLRRDYVPPRIGHQSEAWIRATHFGIRGVSALLHALIRQQTPQWDNQRKKTQRAIKAFEQAANWVRISQHSIPDSAAVPGDQQRGEH